MRCQFTHLHSKCPLLCKGMVLKWKAVHGTKRTEKALHVSTRDPYCTSVGVNPIYENSRKIMYEKCKTFLSVLPFTSWCESEQAEAAPLTREWNVSKFPERTCFHKIFCAAAGKTNSSSSKQNQMIFFHKSSDAIYFLMRIKRLHCGNAVCDKINWWDV